MKKLATTDCTVDIGKAYKMNEYEILIEIAEYRAEENNLS